MRSENLIIPMKKRFKRVHRRKKKRQSQREKKEKEIKIERERHGGRQKE